MLIQQDSPPLSCTIVTDAAQAEELRGEWSRLLQRAERSELTQSPDWLLTWWRVYGRYEGRRLCLGVFHDGERLVGLAPLLRRRCWHHGVLPYRRLEFLASGEPADCGIYSNHLSVLAERGAEAGVAARLVQALTADAFGPWDEVVLPMMSGDTCWPELLAGAFRSANLSVETTTMASAPYIALPSSWEEYLHGLSSNCRRKIERALRTFDHWSGGTTEVQCVTTEAGVEEAKRILIALHQAGWARENESGVFRLPLYLEFHDAMMPTLAKRGELELMILRARGEPVAADYNMVWGHKVYAYQTGRRRDLPNNIRPGLVILAHEIRRAIEQGRREFDLLADDAIYKRQLTPHSRPLVQLRVARPTLVETIRRFGQACVRQVRRLKRTRMEQEPSTANQSANDV